MNQQHLNQGSLRSREFLEALFSRHFKDHEGFIELRLISKESGACLSKFYHLDDINDRSLDEIRQLNTTHHIYFGVNPRPLSKDKKQADIKDVVCLWVDVDGKDFDGDNEEALKRVGAFPSPPTIITDSGHGYHCYWVLRAPKVGLSEGEKLELKQALSGVVKELRGDRSKVNLDACLRLPGTLNIKESEPVECRVLGFNPDKMYELEDFAAFKDVNFKESEKADGDLPAFGSRQLIISLKEPAAATADVKRLEVDSRTQNRIITGALLTAKGADKTRSGRDMSILCRLISSDYDYATIKSVFFNPLLACSNRISSKGEAALQWDVRRALEFVQKHKVEGTPQSRRILEIKNSFSGEEKRLLIAKFITSDLISGQNPAGYGLKDKEQGVFYLFDKDEKLLMSLETIDFYCYMRTRYGISKKDFDEIKDVVMAEIWGKGKEVKPHKFSYFDGRRFILYVSDHASQVYRLDGEKIELCDNGVDGVFFEDDPALSPYTFDPDLEVVNYFAGDEPVEISGLRIRKSPSGLSMSRFLQDNCLLNRFLVDRVNFIQEKDNIVSPVEQKLLLIVFFYSLFFESILHEKPIACFVGKKASGKSFIAVSVGKILFGEKYESCHFPEDTDDLKTALGRNYYLVFDNMDQYLSDDESNVLCVAATGGTVTKRRLYTDSDEVRYTPHCFLVITSREPKFKRDDLVSRLLLFNTQKIGSPIARSALFSSLLAGRNSIMTEVLVNLNTVVKILRLRKDFEPRCISRIADWEVFGRKVCGLSARFLFRLVLQMMNEKKDKFAIEDDYLYLILTRIIYEKNQDLIEKSASDLYSTLLDEAKDMKLSLHDFQRRYKNSRSMGMRLANIREELAREFAVEIFKHPNGQRAYTFLKKFEEEESSASTDTMEAVETVITPESDTDSSSPSETELVADPEETDKPRLAGKALRARIAACKRKIEKNRAARLGPGAKGPERPREDEY